MKRIITIFLLITIILTLVSCNQEINNNNSSSNKNYNKKNGVTTEEIIPRVTFITNGGDALSSIETKVINYQPATFKEDHIFDGWYLDSTFLTPAVFPLEVKYDMFLFAKWVKNHGYSNCIDPDPLKAEIAKPSGYYYVINPVDYDLNRLSELGYNAKIKITYEVKYKKTYDVLFDIGYLGAPEYEVSIKRNNTTVASKNNIKATTSYQEKTIEYTTNVTNLLNGDLTFHYSSDNIQNTIYFDNIVVEYNFFK